MHDLSVHLRVIATAVDIDAASIDNVKVLLKSPEPRISLPPLVAAAAPASVALYVALIMMSPVIKTPVRDAMSIVFQFVMPRATCVDSPPPRVHRNAVHELLVHLENPHTFDIEEACIDMFSPDLNVVNGRLHCIPIPAGQTVQVRDALVIKSVVHSPDFEVLRNATSLHVVAHIAT